MSNVKALKTIWSAITVYYVATWILSIIWTLLLGLVFVAAATFIALYLYNKREPKQVSINYFPEVTEEFFPEVEQPTEIQLPVVETLLEIAPSVDVYDLTWSELKKYAKTQGMTITKTTKKKEVLEFLVPAHASSLIK